MYRAYYGQEKGALPAYLKICINKINYFFVVLNNYFIIPISMVSDQIRL